MGKRPSYSHAIEWIGLNDEPNQTDITKISEMISVQLVADIWMKSETKVAVSVLKWRAEHPGYIAQAVKSDMDRAKMMLFRIKTDDDKKPRCRRPIRPLRDGHPGDRHHTVPKNGR